MNNENISESNLYEARGWITNHSFCFQGTQYEMIKKVVSIRDNLPLSFSPYIYVKDDFLNFINSLLQSNEGIDCLYLDLNNKVIFDAEVVKVYH